MKGTEYGKVKVIYTDKPEIEGMSIDRLDLKDGTKNALKRSGVHTVGEIIKHWKDLTRLPIEYGKSGIGVGKEKEIHASVFALLCEFGCVKKIQYEG